MTNETIPVKTTDIKPYLNEFRIGFKENRFKQTVRINPMTCVYTQWPGTSYQFGISLSKS